MVKKVSEILDQFNLNDINQGGTDKNTFHSYGKIYDEVLSDFINKKGSLLEIGIRSGGSLVLWQELLKNFKIIGLDVENNLHDAIKHKLKFADKTVQILFQDAYEINTVNILKNISPDGFDVIIDDGPHTEESQLKCIDLYLDCLKVNGVLIIEDILNFDFLETLKQSIPTSKIFNYEITIYDHRKEKNKIDDIVFIIKKTKNDQKDYFKNLENYRNNFINLNVSVESSVPLLEEYFCRLQNVLNVECTCEVGAFEAGFSKKIKLNNKNVECWAFEANPHNFIYFNKLEHFYSLGINYVNLAVSDKTEEINFYLQDKIKSTGEDINKVRGNNSILDRNDDNISYRSVRVKSISLDDFFANFNLINKKKSLWIDVEGASKNVLTGCRTSFDNILSIFIEVEEKEYWKSQWFSKDVIEYLESQGFIPIMRDYYDDTQYNIVFINKKIIEDINRAKQINSLIENYLTDIQLLKKDHPITKKLINFPSINFISIEESNDRRNTLYENFKKYGITKYTPHIFKKYNDAEHTIIGNNVDELAPKTHRGPVTSHLKAIKHWYENTNEEYTLFCEDDISFDTVQYWNFTWQEFFDKLPKEWECIQLSLSSTHELYFNKVLYEGQNKLRPRDWCDWSCVAYLMKRSHAKKIIENYFSEDNVICLEYKGVDLPGRISTGQKWPLIPNIETLAYTLFEEKKYTFVFPLFVENMEFKCTWGDFVGFSYNDEKYENNIHLLSYNKIIDWWKNVGQYTVLDKLIDYDYISHWYK